MATATLVSVSEYLETSYRPDCEYVDGELLERNVGELDHSRLQGLLYGYFLVREKLWNITALPEQRIQVRPTRFRVPDISVVAGGLPTTQILTAPPFICIEILSPSDSVYQMQDRIDDYLAFGVPYVWVLNPRTRKAFIYTADGMHEAKDGILRASHIEVPLAELA